MIAHSASLSTPSTWQSRFLEILPSIERRARQAFRWRTKEAHEEAVQAAITIACVTFRRLHEAGKADVATPASLAYCAVRQVVEGRMVGNRLNVRDVMSRYAQRSKRFNVARLNIESWDGESWEEILVEDKRASPADTAAIRIDFAAWMKRLPDRDRRMAELLALGEKTGTVARRFKLSFTRVSQMRRELRASWRNFQGEDCLTGRAAYATT